MTETKNRRQDLDSRVITDLKKQSLMGVPYYFAAMAGILFLDGYYYRDSYFSQMFALGLCLVCLLRVILWQFKDRVPKHLKRLDFYYLIACVLLNSLIWGLAFARVMSRPDEAVTHMLMLATTIALCAGGVVSYAPFLGLAIGFNFLIIWPGVLFMAVHKIHLPLVGLCGIFSFFMIQLSLKGNREYWEALNNASLLKKKTKELERLSYLDGLTGLHNRRFFDTAFNIQWRLAVRSKGHITLLLCDIDKFKQINDTFGHLAGDEFLKLIADKIKKVFQRDTDILVRYGGEEFLILIPNGSNSYISDLAEKLRIEMENTVLNFEYNKIRATVSIGLVTMAPGPADEKETFLSKADQLLYQAKNNGRNQVAGATL